MLNPFEQFFKISFFLNNTQEKSTKSTFKLHKNNSKNFIKTVDSPHSYFFFFFFFKEASPLFLFQIQV